MPSKLVDFGLDRLSADERLTLVQELWNSLEDDIRRAPLSKIEREELDRRLGSHRSDPDALTPWAKIKSRALARSSG